MTIQIVGFARMIRCDHCRCEHVGVEILRPACEINADVKPADGADEGAVVIVLRARHHVERVFLCLNCVSAYLIHRIRDASEVHNQEVSRRQELQHRDQRDRIERLKN